MEARFDTEAKVTRAPSALLPRNLETQLYFYAPVKKEFFENALQTGGICKCGFSFTCEPIKTS